jgi:hypothetical protein
MFSVDVLVIVLSLLAGLEVATLCAMRGLARTMFTVEARIAELEDALLEDDDGPEPERRPTCLRVVPPSVA